MRPILDFTASPFDRVEHFFGRAMGIRDKPHFEDLDISEGFIIHAHNYQTFSGTYFLGLMSIKLACLLKQSKGIDDMLSKIDMCQLNEMSKEEFVKVIKRALSGVMPSLV